MAVTSRLHRIALVLLVAVGVPAVVGKTYYVSWTQGKDSNPGTQDRPWKTLGKVVDTTLGNGDKVLLKSGDIWYEQAVFDGRKLKSGVTIGAYGSGPLPTVSGAWAYDQSQWAPVAGKPNVYSIGLPNNFPDRTVVFYKGRLLEPAHSKIYRAGAGFDEDPTYRLRIDPKYVPPTEYEGGYMTLRAARYLWRHLNVESIDVGSREMRVRVLPGDDPLKTYKEAGYAYFFTGRLEFLNAPGRYLIDNKNRRMYVWLPDNSRPGDIGSAKAVRIAVRDYGFAIGSPTSLTVESIRFEYNMYANLDAGSPVSSTIRNCQFFGSYHAGIEASRFFRSTISANRFEEVMTGFKGFMFSSTISGNTLQNVGMHVEFGRGQTNDGIAIDVEDGSYGMFKSNTISQIGFMGIRADGQRHTVTQNKLDSISLKLDDGGGIYLGPSPQNTGTIISYNLVSNVVGNVEMNGGPQPAKPLGRGIYLDTSTNGVQILYNTVVNSDGSSIFANCMTRDSSIDVIGNVLYSVTWGALIEYRERELRKCKNNRVLNNVFYLGKDGRYDARYAFLQRAPPEFLSVERNYVAEYPQFENNVYVSPYQKLLFQIQPKFSTLGPKDSQVLVLSYDQWKKKYESGSILTTVPAPRKSNSEPVVLFTNPFRTQRTFDLKNEVYHDLRDTKKLYCKKVVLSPGHSVLLAISPITGKCSIYKS